MENDAKQQDSGKKLTAVVTGSSSGLGMEFARQLAQKNYQIVLVSNQEKELNDVARSITEQYAVKTWPLCVNLAANDGAKKVFDFCQQNELEVEVVINNAGIHKMGKLVYMTPEFLEQSTVLHVTTPTLMCRYFGAEMKKRKKGYILNVSSITAWLPYPGMTIYASTKNYLKQFTIAFREEMINSGVFVTAICPGAIDTNLYDIDQKSRNTAKKMRLMFSTETVARKSLNSLYKGKQLVFFGFLTQFLLVLLKLIPLRVIRWSMKEYCSIED